jgi:putative serine protease PepD
VPRAVRGAGLTQCLATPAWASGYVPSVLTMGPKDEEPDEPGEAQADRGGATPWPPPDDRLWRHPSEVGSTPPGAVAPLHPARWAQATGTRAWLVGLASGCLGALASAGVLLASGVVAPRAPVVTSSREAPPPPAPSTSVANSVTSLLELVDPTVVGVTVNGPQGEEMGSGVIVNVLGDESYILTDSAQFSGSSGDMQVQVTTYWGYVAAARLVGTDPVSGVALLKAVLEPAKDVVAANPGSVANVQDGEQVIAVGSEYMAGSNNGPNFTTGYMSDTASYIQPVNGATDGMFSLFPASMSVSSWAYGGAVVDSNGNLLGIVVPVPGQTSGLSYIAPIDTAIVDETAMVKDGQAPAHPWLGVLDATDVAGPRARLLGLDGSVEVESVAAGSPAARAGIADNDVIIALDGRRIGSVGNLIAWLATAKPGEMVTVTWRSGAHKRTSNITLGTQPTAANPA